MVAEAREGRKCGRGLIQLSLELLKEDKGSGGSQPCVGVCLDEAKQRLLFHEKVTIEVESEGSEVGQAWRVRRNRRSRPCGLRS